MQFQIKRTRSNFVDSKRILVRSGAGGTGLPKFGGIGGNGGNIYVQVDKDKKSLRDMPDRLISETGDNAK